MTVKTPKVLFYDIETKPVKANVWRTGKQYINHTQIVEGEKFDIICIAYKWLGERQIHCLDWGLRKQNSKVMIQKFAKVVSEADVVVAHNGDAFDYKQINTQALLHGLPPIQWPDSEDTRKQVRKHFYVTSSAMAYLSDLLLQAEKDRMIFQDWLDIVDKKCPKALEKMIKYCKKDVKLLEGVWKRIQPYVTPKVHKGVALHGDRDSCPSCGSRDFKRDGIVVRRIGRYQAYRCKACAHSFRGTKVLPHTDAK